MGWVELGGGAWACGMKWAFGTAPHTCTHTHTHTPGEGDDKYLIATSEQTLCALHRRAWFEKTELPVK